MNFRFIYTYAKIYGFRTIRRFLAYIIYSLLIPLSILFIFLMIAPNLLSYAIVGGLIVIVIINALNTLVDVAQLRIQYKTQDLLVATGLTPTSYLLGNMLMELVFASPSVILYIIIGIAYRLYTPISLLLMFGVLFLLYVAVSSIAFFLSSFPSRNRSVWSYTNIIALMLSLFPPIYYPYTLLPKPVFYLFLLSPSTSAAILIQSLYGLVPSFPPAIYIFVIESIFWFVVAAKFLRWRSK